jgi:hypothetical protein
MAAAIVGAISVGCGGGSGSNQGSFSIGIRWPTQRTLPELTQFILVRVTSATVNQQATINRPTNGSTTTSTAFSGLPVGVPLVIQADAYGAGSLSTAPLLGIAESTVSLASATGNSITLNLQSTIDLLKFSGPGLSGGTLTLPPSGAASLIVTAFNTATNEVPIGPGNLTFTTSGAGFTISPSGTSVEVAAGASAASGTITATEKESGTTTTINVVVK